MSKVMLFAGDIYYPFGGWNDFKGYFDDVECAKKWLEENEPVANFKWSHIVSDNKIILYGHMNDDDAVEFIESGKTYGWEWRDGE